MLTSGLTCQMQSNYRTQRLRFARGLCYGLVVCDQIACAHSTSMVAGDWRPCRASLNAPLTHVTVSGAFVISTYGSWLGADDSRERRALASVGRYTTAVTRSSTELWMKANKKNKRKRGRQSGRDDGAASSSPRRVDPNAGISVRAQIKYVRMRNTMENAHETAKTRIPNAFRRAKSTDYDDIVEPEDLSHVYMPNIDPSLIVDGYNIVYHCHKSSMMAVQGDLEGARNVLLDELSSVAAMRSWTVTVVFDGHKKQGADRRSHTNTLNQVNAVFTGADESADMYIERQAMELKDSGCPSVMVATGDRLMQNLVASAGAEVFSPDRLIEEIQVCQEEAMTLTQSYISRKQRIIDDTEMAEFVNTARSLEDKVKPKSKRRGDVVGRRRAGGGKNSVDMDLEEMFG